MEVDHGRARGEAKGALSIPGRRVFGPLRSFAEHLGERVMGGLADAVQGLMFHTKVLTPVSKWRTVAQPRTGLPLPRATGEPPLRAAWRVAEDVAFQAPGAPPPPGYEGLDTVGAGPSLWVTDPRTGLKVAHAVEEDEREALVALEPGALAEGLRPELCAALAEVGALRLEGSAVEPSAERERLRSELATDGFVLVPELVAPGLLAALQTHYLALPSQVRLEADPFSGRLVEKNEAVARHILLGLAGFVGSLVGREVRPSYCYCMWYAPGARLRVHRDNALCEYTFNLVIDQQPPQPSHWPLCMVSRRGRIEEVYLRPGDAVLFRGRELAHYRRRLRGSGSAIGVLLHYVDADFAGDLGAAGAYD